MSHKRWLLTQQFIMEYVSKPTLFETVQTKAARYEK
jgi:hypothetical protein